jgi:hypothetical protein
MADYLLTGDAFIGGVRRVKGEMVAFDGPPSKVMREISRTGPVPEAVPEAVSEAPEPEPVEPKPEAATGAAADGKGAIPLRKPRQKAEASIQTGQED